MYYRVENFNGANSNMNVLDSDASIEKLESRDTIEDCAHIHTQQFHNAQLVKPQQVICVSMGGEAINSHIIKTN